MKRYRVLNIDFDIRNGAIHFQPETDRNDRALALTAIETVGRVIDAQFNAFGTHPWFIPNTPGTTFLKKSAEIDPFVRTVYIPNCALVGPYHKLENFRDRFFIRDDFPYENKEISDEEFAQLHNDRSTHPSV